MNFIQKFSIALALLCAYAPSLSAGKLHDLIKKGNSKQVEKFLKTRAKASINTPDNDGCTPLHIACIKNNFSIIKLLLKNGAKASINTPNNFGWTPLGIACTESNLSIVKRLLKNGAAATPATEYDASPLTIIIDTWNIKERKKLLMMLVPAAKNLPKSTKTFIELVITTLAGEIKQSSAIAPKVPQNDGLLKSQVIENPKQRIACIEEFTKIFLFESRKKDYTWLDENANLNKFKIICPLDFQYSPSQIRIKINFGINYDQYAFLRRLQDMAHKAIVQPKTIEFSSNSTSSKDKPYRKLCDIIIKCHKPSSTESSVRFEDVTKQYSN